MIVVHRSIVLLVLLLSAPGFASGNVGATSDIYRLVADKYGVDAAVLYARANQLAGRAVSFSDHKAPWPWTLQYCVNDQCEIVFAKDRQSLFNTARYCVDQGFALALGPLLMSWEAASGRFGENLWIATDPRASINMVVRHGLDQPVLVKTDLLVADKRAISPPDIRVLVENISAQHGIDPHLVYSIIRVESNYIPDAVSSKGAVGLMQLMPATGKRFGVMADQRTDPVKNISAGVKYLSYLSKLFDGNTVLMLAAYNAGEGAVKKHNNTVPPYPETMDYVSKVLKRYDSEKDKA